MLNANILPYSNSMLMLNFDIDIVVEASATPFTIHVPKVRETIADSRICQFILKIPQLINP